jgi:hypothetical protein
VKRLDTVAQTLSNIVANDLTHISVPTEDIKHVLKGSSTFVPTHAPNGPVLACPLKPIMDEYNQNNDIKNKSKHNPNSYTKTTNKE